MKNFLIKSLLFLLAIAVYFVANMFVNRLLLNKQKVPVKDRAVLIVGDSHPQKGIDPNLFENAQNISQPAEPYVLTYWKLEKIFQTSVPDTLILGFAPHNISEFNDSKFSDKVLASALFERSYSIEKLDDIAGRVPVDYNAYYKTLWKQTAFYPKRNHVGYLGRYTNNKLSSTADWETAVQRHYFDGEVAFNVSSLALDYLNLIVDLCAANNVELVLVSHPVHENYLNNIPQHITDKHSSLMSQYGKDNIVINNTAKVYPDSLYLNSDHLNAYGAERFTNEIIEILRTTRN